MRLVVAKDELDAMLSHKGTCISCYCYVVDMQASRAPILFFANKMDLPGALEPVECNSWCCISYITVAQALNLDAITNKAWFIKGSNALTGEGLDDGVQWLVERL